MFGLNRRSRAGPLLEWKVRLFSAGAVLGLAGIYLDDRRITAGAIAVLGIGVVLRFVGQRVGKDRPGDDGGS